MREVIIIFDIDGCICESFFPNLNEKANIKELREKILETPLNRDFSQFYKRITNNTGVKTFFLTGRRAKDFEKETLDQLKVLDITPDQIIFFPDNYNHTKIRYNTFKIYHILSIYLKNRGDALIVFDDTDSYYAKLFDLGLSLDISKMRIYNVKDLNILWLKKLTSK